MPNASILYHHSSFIIIMPAERDALCPSLFLVAFVSLAHNAFRAARGRFLELFLATQ
jgi:hypothetical protein